MLRRRTGLALANLQTLESETSFHNLTIISFYLFDQRHFSWQASLTRVNALVRKPLRGQKARLARELDAGRCGLVE